MVETKDLDDRSRKDIIGICVTHSQDPETMLANLRRVFSVLAAHLE